MKRRLIGLYGAGDDANTSSARCCWSAHWGQCTAGDARRTTGCAANRPFEQTREHYGRIVALDRHHWRDEIVEAAPLAAEPYPAISVDLPARIVHDLRVDVKPYGLHLPEIQITCTFAPELLFVVWDD